MNTTKIASPSLPGDEWQVYNNRVKLGTLLELANKLLQEDDGLVEVRFSISSFDRDGLRANIVVSSRLGGNWGEWDHFTGCRPASGEEAVIAGEVFHLTKVFTQNGVPWDLGGWAELTVNRDGNVSFEHGSE